MVVKITPPSIFLLLVTGLLAVWLFIQINKENQAQQTAMEAAQRCSGARFDATYDRSLGNESAQQKAMDAVRIARVCGEAQKQRRNLQSVQQSTGAAQAKVASSILH